MNDRILIRKLQKSEEILDTVLKGIKNFQESFDKSLNIKSKTYGEFTKEELVVIESIGDKLREIRSIL